MQLILETNISAQKDTLKSSLQDLLGENELLKKNALQYQKDITK